MHCPCGETYHVSPTHVGARIRCRRCDRVLEIPEQKTPPPSQSARRRRVPEEAIVRPRSATERVWGRWQRRVRAAVSHFGRASGSRSEHWSAPFTSTIGLLVTSAAFGALALATYLRFQADRSPLGMLLLFAPLWWLTFPWLLLVPIAFVKSWRVGGVALFGALLTLFGVSRFEVPDLVSPEADRRALRIVSYNTDRSARLADRVRSDIAEWNADVVLFQDCKTIVSDSLRAITTLTVHVTPEFCFATRLPLEQVDSLPTVLRPGTQGVGRFGRAMRYVVRANGVALPIYSVHLESPRDALWAALHLDFSLLQNSVNWRAMDSRLTSNWISRADSAFVVAGDFNLPAGSRVLSDDWSDLENAISVRHLGFGHTMIAGKHRVRIDHVMAPPTLVPEAVRLYREFPSEHQPILVDYAWRGALQGTR